jgi:transcriptional regulator with XRE-family HTH domain
MGRYRANGPRIRALRRRRFLSIEELARLAGVSPYTVQSLETGRRQAIARTILRLSDALKVPPAELVLEDEPEIPAPERDHLEHHDLHGRHTRR